MPVKRLLGMFDQFAGMGRANVKFGIVVGLLVLLSGCGDGWSGHPREPWRDKAENRCLRSGIVQTSSTIQYHGRVNGPGSCGAQRPFRVSAFPNTGVTLDSDAVLACPMVPAMDRWLTQSVQPAALVFHGQPVAEIELAGSYSCRRRNGKRTGKMSEHAYLNALDVKAFRLSDGRRITVQRGWRGEAADAEFLRAVHSGACHHFKTVIGPDGDRHHQDHFHLDLAWHGKDGTYVHCE